MPQGDFFDGENMFGFLMPKSLPFFDMLDEQNARLRQMTDKLVLLLETNDSVRCNALHRDNAALEEKGDALYGRIVRGLSQTFITPIDREDLLRIAQKQEEAMDCLYGLSIRLTIFEFRRKVFPAQRMARSIRAMLALTAVMLDGLRRRKDCHKTHGFRELRSEADSLLSIGLAELMEDREIFAYQDVMQILKWTQIYEHLNLLLHHIADLGETVEEAVMKNV